MSNIWICVVNRVGSASRPLSFRQSWVGKTLTLDTACTFFRLILHFIPLPVTSTLVWGHKVNSKQKPVDFIFLHSFQLSGMMFIEAVKQFKMNILILPLSEIYLIKGNRCCPKTDMYSDVYEPIWFKLGLMKDSTEVCVVFLLLHVYTLYFPVRVWYRAERTSRWS